MKTRLTVATVVISALFLLIPSLALSQCTLVTSVNPPLTPDGSPTTTSVPTNGARYVANLTEGGSYSLKIVLPQGYSGSAPTLTGTGPFFCGSPPLPLTNTSVIQPQVFFQGIATDIRGGIRVNFTIPSTGGYAFDFQHFAGGTATVTAVLVETTLFSPLWSTFGGFETFYRFQNTSNGVCNVTLRMVNDAGMQVANTTFPILHNSTVPTVFTGPTAQGGLNLANDQAGQAIITHNCPPGAIQVDGFTGRFDLATPVVLPIKIQTAREHAN